MDFKPRQNLLTLFGIRYKKKGARCRRFVQGGRGRKTPEANVRQKFFVRQPFSSFCRFCRKAVKEKAALRRSFLYCLPVGILADLHDPQDGLDFAHAVVSAVSEQATATIVFAQVALLTECRRAEPTKITVGVGHKNCHLFSPFLFIVILVRAPHWSP